MTTEHNNNNWLKNKNSFRISLPRLPLAMFTDAYLQVVKTSTAQVNKINWSLSFGLIVVTVVHEWNSYFPLEWM